MKVTHRSPHTVNVYLGYIRKYLDTYHLTLEGFRLEVAESVKVPRLAEGGGFITSTVNVITTSSDFMLAYVPLMVLALGLSGQPISGAGYYSVGLLLFRKMQKRFAIYL